LGKLREGQLLDRNQVHHDIGAQIGRQARCQVPREVVMKLMNGAKLVFGDTVRPAEIIGYGCGRNFPCVGLAQVPEDTVDLRLR